MDNVSSAMGVGAGIVIVTPKGVRVEHYFRLGCKASNNEAEYEALLAGLKVACSLGVIDLEVYSDSWLFVSQVEGSFEAKDPWMIDYLRLVKKTMSQFQKVKLVQISQEQNRHADSLATLASSLIEDVPQLIKVEVVKEPSIDMKVNVSAIKVFDPCWMDLIIEFLAENRLPSEGKEAKRVRRISPRF